MPFQKMLVANRGEIAMRVIRACQDLGIATVAVYTDLDRDCRHVKLADQAFALGDKTYLDMAALWAIAAQAGCDALHPGYGFLAENPDFARGTVARGMAWVGPRAAAIDEMGSKLAARRIAIAQGVPIVPGLAECVTDAGQITAFAAEFGYPVLIKAANGGGGRGQVVVNTPEEIGPGLERARREGLSYFASDLVYVERFLTHPRHVEVQVVGDHHGTVTHLGERDCSIQRRNQKLVEESPSPAVDEALRAQLGAAACAVAKAVGYDSVGTVEFMVEDGKFYFLEMNTRIQVEHTVTEMVYRCDLVQEMIRIAAGQPMDPTLVGRTPAGWAMQVRLNAEDPAANYRPTPGTLTRYVRPEGPWVRLDGAAYEGWTIPNAYDSLIAKLITWGADRPEAIARMRRALAETVIEGVPTTLTLHRTIMDNAKFNGGDFSTRFLADDLDAAERARIQAAPAALAPTSTEAPVRREFTVEVNHQHFKVAVLEPAGVGAAKKGPSRPAPVAKAAGVAGNDVSAPMMSRVVKVCVAPGDVVVAGQALVVIEAMKMESELASPRAGTVAAVTCAAGDTVEVGKVLVSLAVG